MPVTVDMGSRDVTIAPAQARGVVVREGPQGIQGERGPTGVQGPPGDLTKEVADATYERKLIDTAVWRVDAGAVGTDGKSLIDLSGNGRPAVFGAGAAAPLVLPWDGEDYVYLPGGDFVSNINIITVGAGTPGGTVAVVTMRADLPSAVVAYTTALFMIHPDNNVNGAWRMDLMGNTGKLRSALRGAAALTLEFQPSSKQWHRFTVDSSTGALEYADSDDGTSWSVVHNASHGGTLSIPSGYFRLGAHGAVARTPEMRVYGASLAFDAAAPLHILDPRNVNADYTKIKNTGSAGGDWTINRASSGFKTAVVDRPLLLFGGGQTLNRPPALPYSTAQTMLAAFRRFGTTGTEVVIDTRSVAAQAPDGMAFITANGVPSYRVVGKSIGWSPSGKNVISGNSSMAVVGSASDCRAYENGVLVATTASMDWDGGDSDGPQIGSRGGSFGANMEFIAAAIFDRALTDAQVAQASAELLGTPHHAQAAPHQSHPPLVAGTTPAALPVGAREGTIAVLADNRIAVRTRTGGWKVLTATDLTGAPPA